MNVRTLTSPGLSETWRSQRGAVIALGIGLVALGFLFHVEVTSAIAVWIDSTAYNHCFLVLPIVAYLVWDRKDTLAGSGARPFPLAALAGIPLVLAWLFAERLGIMEGRQLVAISFVELLFFAILGPRLWWRLAGPLLYLYFLVPFGEFLTPWLQDITTVFVRHGLELIGIPAYIDGYVIEIPEGTFLVAEACAGLRFLIAAFAFGCLYALIMYRSPLRRAIFIAVSLVVPIIANGMRALGIVALGHYLGSAQAAETDHILYGWIFFSIVILLLIVFGLPFRQDQPSQPTGQPVRAIPDIAYLRPAMAGAAALVFVAAIGPAIAAQLNNAANAHMAGGVSPLVPAAGCSTLPAPLTDGLDAPGRMSVQHIVCGNITMALSIERFAPRSIPNIVLTEQRRMTGEAGSEDSQSSSLGAPGIPPGMWRLVETMNPNRAIATSLWVEGKPASGGLHMRMRQALNTITGSRYAPVLVIVTPETSTLGSAPLAGTAARSAIIGFLQSQPELTDLVARLAGAN